MSDPSQQIAEMLHRDRRYAFDAYVFVFEALRFAHEVLHLGTESPSEPLDLPGAPREPEDVAERHVSGRELCEAIRLFALDQFGYMAKTVLNSWGVRRTGDFGEIVFNLIGIGRAARDDLRNRSRPCPRRRSPNLPRRLPPCRRSRGGGSWRR